MIEAVFTKEGGPSPIAFQNVYVDGDRWEKVQGCEACPPDDNCCPDSCGAKANDKCSIHMVNPGQKPHDCCMQPNPIKRMNKCRLVWKCAKGRNKGKYRFKCDDQNHFRDEGP
jgi:hypothetical protein